MSFKQALAANRWLRAQLAVLVLVAVNLALMIALDSAWLLLPGMLLLVASVPCWINSKRTGRELAAAKAHDEAEARVLRTPRAPNAGQDQCPVCGGYGLTDLAADDKLMDRGPDRAKVAAWGRKRAHWDCAEWSPYVPTPEEKARDTHYRKHGQAEHVRTCDWCFTEDERWEPAASGRRFERTPPVLTATAERGARQVHLSHKADPKVRHWLLNSGAPSRHMDVLTIESCERASYGDGWVAHLAEPLRHPLYFVETCNGNIRFGGQTLMALDSERLWNRDAGRPYTRTELGLCDCGAPVLTGKLRASLGGGFDAYMQEALDTVDRLTVELGLLTPDQEAIRRRP